jgi:hypothetical protein
VLNNRQQRALLEPQHGGVHSAGTDDSHPDVRLLGTHQAGSPADRHARAPVSGRLNLRPRTHLCRGHFLPIHSMNIPNITQTGLTLDQWTQTKRTDPRPLDGFHIEGFYSVSYAHQSIEKLVLARFFLHDAEVHRAWGWATEKCCSYHLLFLEDNPTPRAGCPPVKVLDQEHSLLQYTTESGILSTPITLNS